MSRRTVFLTAAVVTAFAFGSLPADAAMPVSGGQQVATGSDIVLAQAPPAAPAAPAAAQEQTAAPAKKGKKLTPRQEADQSVQSGTVPKRYMGNVPKEYHHLIPFSK